MKYEELDNGAILISGIASLPLWAGIEEAAAHACHARLRACRPFLHGKVNVETDCASFSAALNQASRNISSLCFVSSEINDLVQLLPEVLFCFSNRDSSCVAQALAHLGRCNGMLGT
jgi:hypothetical protein